MGVQIYVPASETWAFYCDNRDRLKEEMVMIAENTETRYAVYLTEERELPIFCVCKGEGESEYEEGAIGKADCEDTSERLYAKYLFPLVIDSGKSFPESSSDFDGEEDAIQSALDIDYEREDELALALCDFLAVALDFDDDPPEIYNRYGEDFVGETLEHILRYLDEEWSIVVRRPPLLDEDGFWR